MMMNDLPRMQVLITTDEQLITGELILPENMRFSSYVPENMLFYILNGGFQFIIIKHCEIKDRKNLVFRPDKSNQMLVNTSSIVTIQILEILPANYVYDEDEDDNAEFKKNRK